MAKIGRNDPCSCGSGKKYKQCCQPLLEAKASEQAEVDQYICEAFQSALAYHRGRCWAEAEADYRKVLERMPGHADALYLLGTVARECGRHEETITLTEQALGIAPNHAEAHNSLGVALKEAGRIDEAIDHYQQALAINPDFADARLNLGLAYQQLDKLTDAAASYRQTLKLKPDCAEAYNNLGMVYKLQGRYDDAITCHERAVILKPEFPEALNNLGVALKALERFDEALLCYQRAIQLRPGFFAAYNNLANVLQLLGRMEDALETYVIALGHAPDSFEAHNNLGAVFEEKGELERAFACYQRSVALNPNYGEAHNNLGNAWRRQGDLDQAVASYQKAVALNPQSAVACSNLGNALKEQGNLDAAMVASLATLRLEPEGFSGLVSATRLAILQFLTGDAVQAAATLNSCRSLLSKEDPRFAAPQEYWTLLQKLLLLMSQREGDGTVPSAAVLHVVGESHMLSVHGVSIAYRGAALSGSGYWIEGCKQWHLANGESNIYKTQFSRILGKIPRDTIILLTIGEIDCRVDEGIFPVWQERYSDQSLEAVAQRTVTGFLNYACGVAAERNQKLLVCGIPAPRMALATASPDIRKQFLPMVAGVNAALRQCAQERGVGFVDLYGLTHSGNGISDGRWHIDDHHLLPEAYAEAFRNHLFDAEDPLLRQEATPTAEALLTQAVAHHQAGALPEAERGYRAILQLIPSHSDANHNLGVLAIQCNQLMTALPLLKTALETEPARSQYWLTYLEALISAGEITLARQVLEQGRQHGLQDDIFDALIHRLDALSPSSLTNPQIELLQSLFSERKYSEAVVLAETLTECFPMNGLVWKLLSLGYREIGRRSDALRAMQRAAEIAPDDAAIQNNLGVFFHEQERLEDAAASFRRALECKPGYPEGLSNLGNVLQDQGGLEEAVTCYRLALEIRPDYAEAHSNLGIALCSLGQLAEAEDSYRQALVIYEPSAKTHGNLGVVLQEQGRLDEAVAHYRRSLEIDPDFSEGYANLGAVLRNQGLLEAAAASCLRAVELNPANQEAHSNLGNIYRDSGQLEAALVSYRRALEVKPDYLEAYSNLLFIHNYLANYPTDSLLEEARGYGRLVAAKAQPFLTWNNPPDIGRRLRIGMVSGDFRNHPVGYFLESLLQALTKRHGDEMELVAYANHHGSDRLTERLRACCQTWRLTIGLTDKQLADQIRDDRIDILIDLSGHTALNRLPVFAWKPAPIQVSWLGYFATTGVSGIDYLIADPWTLPEALETHFTENVWRLPETRLCFTPPEFQVDPGPLPALQHGYITFGCFNNLAKMNDDVVALWVRVLASVQNSRLFLKAKPFFDVAVRESVLKRFAEHGISAERLILEGFDRRADYLAAYQRVDIALDPFPFPGGTTSVESLWMGVPVLTLEGGRFLSRQGVGLLINAGLPEWIAENEEAYVARAVFHGMDLSKLSELRSGLRQQVLASPIFDAALFAQHFSSALRGMWQSWCKEQVPRMKAFLHVGCGPNYKNNTTRGFNLPEWKELRFDIDESVNPDMVGTMLDMSAVPDASVDAVFSSHNIEHLYSHEVPLALKEFLRVLKPDGFLVITCPDLQSVCALVAEDRLTEAAYNSPAGPITPLDILYGHRPAMARGNLFMAHRCGFTQKVLVGTLESVGFAMVASQRRSHPCYDLHALATKKVMEESTLRALAALHFPG